MPHKQQMKKILEGNELDVVQRLVDKISTGNFEDLQVRQLLSELRDFSSNNSLFFELANFIAHQ